VTAKRWRKLALADERHDPQHAPDTVRPGHGRGWQLAWTPRPWRPSARPETREDRPRPAQAIVEFIQDKSGATGVRRNSTECCPTPRGVSSAGENASPWTTRGHDRPACPYEPADPVCRPIGPRPRGGRRLERADQGVLGQPSPRASTQCCAPAWQRSARARFQKARS